MDLVGSRTTSRKKTKDKRRKTKDMSTTTKKKYGMKFPTTFISSGDIQRIEVAGAGNRVAVYGFGDDATALKVAYDAAMLAEDGRTRDTQPRAAEEVFAEAVQFGGEAARVAIARQVKAASDRALQAETRLHAAMCGEPEMAE